MNVMLENLVVLLSLSLPIPWMAQVTQPVLHLTAIFVELSTQ